jgi:Uma2 family endonuclease
MVHLPRPERPLSIEEYLELEEASAIRHEYVAGDVHAMTGVTRRHSRIAGNVFAHVWGAARGTTCRVHASELKLHVGDALYYPDVMAACGPEPADARIENAPCLLVEVTSPSTESVDRREKLMVYKRLPGLRDYLIIDQLQRLVDRYWRHSDGSWRHTLVADAGDVPIGCPAFVLTLDQIYAGVDMPTPDERLRLREEEAAYR